MNSSDRPDMTWWRESRFGMFIHWGLYSIPGGEWKDPLDAGSAEWIMCHKKIPVRDYEKLAAEFNPVEFDADGIAGLARDAGMKYLVITAKHHEGFAMFRSKASTYNIIDATPFGRDIIEELSEACARKGVRFGVYYSQALDWHHPDAAGNTWDYPDEDKKNFQHFLDDKVYPQVDELLSNYGPICELWFDTPSKITAEQARSLLNFVRAKQPDCIVNSRLGPGGDKQWGDFVSLRDNEVPTLPLREDGETCSTINGHWGFNKHDLDFRPAHTITRLLADVVAKNANYLLNIGPDGMGRVPEGSVKVLQEIGRWMSINGEAIYATQPTPFSCDFDWGAVTRRSGRVYFHLFDSPGENLVIRGLRNEPGSASFLDEPDVPLSVHQADTRSGADVRDTIISVKPAEGEGMHRVLALDIKGDVDIYPGILQQPDGAIVLESLMAKNALTGTSMVDELVVRGAVAQTLRNGHVLEWDLETVNPGTFDVLVECATGRYTDHGGLKVVDTGHEICIEIENEKCDGIINEGERFGIRGNNHWQAIRCKVGSVRIEQAGRHMLRMTVNRVVDNAGSGFILRQIRLVPSG